MSEFLMGRNNFIKLAWYFATLCRSQPLLNAVPSVAGAWTALRTGWPSSHTESRLLDGNQQIRRRIRSLNYCAA